MTSVSQNQRNRFYRRVSAYLRYAFIVLALGLVYLGPAGTSPCHAGFWPFSYDDAYEKSRDEFKAVHESVSTTKDTVEKAKLAVDAVATDLDDQINRLKRAGDAVPKELKDAAAKVKNAQKTLERSLEVLSNFGDYSEKITAATDVYDEIVELRKKMAADSQTLGPLGGELRALGTLMQKADNVPILGEAIKAYGEITTGLVDKLGEVATTIDKNRNQDLIGEGAYDTNEKARIFREFKRSHPELVGLTYEPSIPVYLYVPEDEARGGPGVLWNEDTKQFSVVPKGAPAKAIFQMQLLNNKRLEASQLTMHMEEWPKGGAKRLETARAMHDFFVKLRRFDYSTVSANSHEDLPLWLRNPRLFEARYVYDRNAHEQLHHDLKAIYDGFMAKGDDDSKKQAALIRKFAQKHKLDIAFAPAATPQKTEQKTTKKEESSTVESFFKSLNDGLEKLNKDLEKLNTTTSAPQKAATPPPAPPAEVKKTEQKPAAPARSPGKAPGQIGTCSECFESGLECSCGREACRCCSPGDSSCNAFDL